jgi:hypothetical protein
MTPNSPPPPVFVTRPETDDAEAPTAGLITPAAALAQAALMKDLRCILFDLSHFLEIFFTLGIIAQKCGQAHGFFA